MGSSDSCTISIPAKLVIEQGESAEKKFSNDEIKVALSFSVEWPLESNLAGICLLQIFRGIRVAFL
jgi:hypothetical protein